MYEDKCNWKNFILEQTKNEYSRDDVIEEINSRGYNIKIETEKLQQFYLNNSEK